MKKTNFIWGCIMIFSKDYSDDQLPYTHSDRFLYARVLISAIFLCLSIFLTLIGKDTLIGPVVLFVGIVWNLFLPLDNQLGLYASIMMSMVYALICVSIGLVANAFLYIAYYIPLQYMAIRNQGESFILKGKKLTDKEGFFVLFYYILFFIGIYIFSSTVASSLLCLIDSASATLLAVSALVRNLRLGSYYKVRFAALAVSIFLWAMLATAEVRYSGATSVLLMYIMYFVYEIVVLIYEKRHYLDKSMVEKQEKKEKETKKLAEKKKKQLKDLTK